MYAMVTQNMQNTTTSRMHYQDKESRSESAHYSVHQKKSRHFPEKVRKRKLETPRHMKPED
jgi:hypothetical protein